MVLPLAVTDQDAITEGVQSQARNHCFHCGNRCDSGHFASGDRSFCCQGCLTVHEILQENGLSEYYTLEAGAGVRVSTPVLGKHEFLDEPSVRRQLASFSNEKITRVQFRIPAIHCIACVWLLENLFRIEPGIARAEVDFLRKEASVTFLNAEVRLSEVVDLLARLGYEPELKFSDLQPKTRGPSSHQLWLQLGVAGFAFGNNMLFAIALYVGADTGMGPAFKVLVGYLSLGLALPVLLFSAKDYFRQAWQGLRQGMLTIEAPIAAGIVAMFAQSAFDVLVGRGVGYFDSFAGLVFFLLCGRVFQEKSFARLAFDRDFRSFFPLSATRRRDGRETQVSLSEIKEGDRLVIRNGEMIPADGRLVSGQALVDYSFVTGEADPAAVEAGGTVQAGGRQVGGAIEMETDKAVSQSYLTSLWNQDIFQKPNPEPLDSLINEYSRRFTKIVVAIALGSAAFWAFTDSSKALTAFTSVLIVACPCALALAAPFSLGSAIRLLGRLDVYVKNPRVIERMAGINSIVFDKTGTLTSPGEGGLSFAGAALTEEERTWIRSVAGQSVHPNSVRIAEGLEGGTAGVRSFSETVGSGIQGTVEGREIWIGSAGWLESRGVRGSKDVRNNAVHVAIDGVCRGSFSLPSAVRPGVAAMIQALGRDHRVGLLSGDNERESRKFTEIFGPQAAVKFNQTPLDKLDYVRAIQGEGRRVAMVGDGLNDAGALKQSDVGIAVVEKIGAFSPASDIILRAEMAPRLPAIFQFSKDARRIIWASFAISSVYNVVGIGIAAAAKLAPVVCAVLMPLSSISVVAFACGATAWRARRLGLWKE